MSYEKHGGRGDSASSIRVLSTGGRSCRIVAAAAETAALCEG